jgi:hypothetical protein
MLLLSTLLLLIAGISAVACGIDYACMPAIAVILLFLAYL